MKNNRGRGNVPTGSPKVAKRIYIKVSETKIYLYLILTVPIINCDSTSPPVNKDICLDI